MAAVDSLWQVPHPHSPTLTVRATTLREPPTPPASHKRGLVHKLCFWIVIACNAQYTHKLNACNYVSVSFHDLVRSINVFMSAPVLPKGTGISSCDESFGACNTVYIIIILMSLVLVVVCIFIYCMELCPYEMYLLVFHIIFWNCQRHGYFFPFLTSWRLNL